MTFESQYRFANISATKTRIFMKFETYIHKILKNYLVIFRKDPCTHARTRDKNMRARVSYRQNASAHIYASCVCVCARIFTKNLLIILYCLMNFQKSSLFNVFPIFSHLHPSKVFKDGELLNSHGIFWKLVIKMYICNGQKDTCPSLLVAF